MTLLRLSGLLPVLALAACVPTTARQPQPQPQPVAPPVQVLPPRPAQQLPAPTPSVDWIDAALSAGDWTYRQGGSAAFGPPASPSFVIACTGARIRLERTGAASGAQLTIRTSSEARTLAATPTAGGLVAELAASDPLLDAIAFSRGRLATAAEGAPMVAVPAWPEIDRVIEDCRS